MWMKYLPCSNYFFFHGWTTLVSLGLIIVEVSRSHSEASDSVGLLSTSDQPVAKTSTSTWRHATLNTKRDPWPTGFEIAIHAIKIIVIAILEHNQKARQKCHFESKREIRYEYFEMNFRSLNLLTNQFWHTQWQKKCGLCEHPAHKQTNTQIYICIYSKGRRGNYFLRESY